LADKAGFFYFAVFAIHAICESYNSVISIKLKTYVYVSAAAGLLPVNGTH
jgi:hypothetical protein